MTEQLIEGEVIEGTITRCLRRDLILDSYFTFASFAVCKKAVDGTKASRPVTIVFLDAQSDIISPPRNCFVRAIVDSVNPFACSPFAPDVPVMLTDIAFVERGTGRVVSRIKPAPRFAC